MGNLIERLMGRRETVQPDCGVEAVAERLMECRAELKLLAREEEELKKKLKGVVKESGKTAVIFGRFMVSVSTRSNTSFDKVALSTYLGDLYKSFEKKSSYEMLDVKELG